MHYTEMKVNNHGLSIHGRKKRLATQIEKFLEDTLLFRYAWHIKITKNKEVLVFECSTENWGDELFFIYEDKYCAENLATQLELDPEETEPLLWILKDF